MIFMRMGDEDRLQPVQLVVQPADVGQDQVHPGRGVHVGKGHAHIDQDQPFFARRPVAVDIGVHADLPRAAEGKIDQPVRGHGVSLLKALIRTRPRMVRSSSTL